MRKKWVWVAVHITHLDITKELLKREKFMFKQKDIVNGKYVILEVANLDFSNNESIYEKVQHIADKAKNLA